jgi:hypothetical protein
MAMSGTFVPLHLLVFLVNQSESKAVAKSAIILSWGSISALVRKARSGEAFTPKFVALDVYKHA